MSMISGLIDELNKSADEWNGSNMFELARMCREAADTIWQLRDDLQRANAENAKLRESVNRLMTQRDERLARAETENAKLRELSSIMLKCIMANERKKLICWECPMHKQFDELRSYCCLEHEAKKLGVEVG